MRFKYWFPSAAVAALIFIVSSIPLKAPKVFQFWSADKLVHLVLYGVFAVCLRKTFQHVKNHFIAKRPELFTLLTAALYGAFDEMHQYFVPHRTVSALDFCADVAGAAIGLIILQICLAGKEHRAEIF